MDPFNIVDLIENNPITKLSTTYQNKLLTKIKTKFTETEQQLFVASFYGFLKYDANTDFVIDLDDVWKWVGFAQKVKATVLLEKHFIMDKDYTKSLTQVGKQSDHIRGGHNKEIFMLNVATFKRFCLKAGTKKADEIHEYYIKLEEILHEVVQEESNELKTQLEQTTIVLEQTTIVLEQKTILLEKTEKISDKIREKTLLEQFGRNTQCVYYGSIDNVSGTNERLLKFGNSNNLAGRVSQHKETYSNFRLLNAFKVDNKLQVENEMKEHPLFAERQRTITIKSKNYIELLSMNGLTFTILDKTIRDIIYEKKRLTKIIESHDQFNNMNELILLRSENKHLKIENLRIIKKYNKRTPTFTSPASTFTFEPHSDPDSESDSEPETVTEKEVENYGIVINQIRTKRRDKSDDGFFHIDGRTYELLEGTRTDVWNGRAYQTAGGLIKTDLLVNNDGKIVSKSKVIESVINNKLDVVNQRKRLRIVSKIEGVTPPNGGI